MKYNSFYLDLLMTYQKLEYTKMFNSSFELSLNINQDSVTIKEDNEIDSPSRFLYGLKHVYQYKEFKQNFEDVNQALYFFKNKNYKKFDCSFYSSLEKIIFYPLSYSNEDNNLINDIENNDLFYVRNIFKLTLEQYSDINKERIKKYIDFIDHANIYYKIFKDIPKEIEDTHKLSQQNLISILNTPFKEEFSNKIDDELYQQAKRILLDHHLKQ